MLPLWRESRGTTDSWPVGGCRLWLLPTLDSLKVLISISTY